MDSVRSVALGFWIGTGSSNEDEPRAGLSHLIEHMLFRGTARYGSLEIDQIFDAMGAELNAGTGKETTSVYARVLDVHLPEALDVIADMVWRPRFAEDDLVNERQIVLEEIAMYEDDPQDKVFDVLGERGLRRPPAGPRDHRPRRRRRRHARRRPARLPRRALRARERRRRGGRLGRPRRPRRAHRRGAGRARRAPRSRRPSRRRPRRPRVVRFLTQGHRAGPRLPSAAPASPATTSAATRCASSTRSSAARRPRGCSRRCARSAAWPTASTRSSRSSPGPGQVGLYLGTRPDNVARRAARRRRRAHPRRARTPPTPTSSTGPRRTSRAASCSRLESTAARMNRLGSSLLAGLPLLTRRRDDRAHRRRHASRTSPS